MNEVTNLTDIRKDRGIPDASWWKDLDPSLQGYYRAISSAFEQGLLPSEQVLREMLKLDLDLKGKFQLIVDHDHEIDSQIATRCGWTHQDIVSNYFHLSGTGIVKYEADLVSFDGKDSTAIIQAIKSADSKNPWMVAKMEHLLSFQDNFLEEVDEHQIIALGSVIELNTHLHDYVPYIALSGSGCELNLLWYGGVWKPECKFLVVRKLAA
jgi:hypothetical protein